MMRYFAIFFFLFNRILIFHQNESTSKTAIPIKALNVLAALNGLSKPHEAALSHDG